MFQQCEIAYAGAPAPASPGGDVCQFGWNARSYAAATLMDPGNPASPAYTQRLWQDFDAILNWTNWNPARNNCDYFPAASYAVGEILPALVLAYDWHGDELDAAAKRRYAERLADCADALMELGYVDPFPPLPRNVNTIHNNKTISRQAALAGLDRLLAAEIPESRRAPWRARADQDYDLLRQALPADGSNHEGASYSAHSNESLFFWTETRRLNGDVNVYDSSPWFAAAPWFELYSMLPGRIGNAGGVLPFGNAAEAPFGSHRMTMGLLGARRRDPIAQWIAEFSDFTHIDEEEPMWKTFETMPADPSALPNWRLFPDSGTFVYRSDWTPQAMYFAEKCGPMWGGHEHPDSGAFVVYRNGFPYIAAPHYLLGQRVEDENILLANGQGLQGIPASAGGYSDYVPEESWGRIVQALGSPGYFNVLADPCKAYQPAAQLSVYTREFVGAPDVIVLRDQFALPAPSTVDLLFHGYKTDPETIAGVRYDPNQYPLDPVFKLSSGIYRLYPNETACPTESMAILDASRSTWSARIDPSIVVPDLIPGYVPPGQGRLSNAAMNAYTRGQMLRRTLTNAQNDSSVLLFHFRGDTFRARKWGDGKTHDGVVFTEPTLGDRLKVVWPTGGALDASEGLTVRGAMAMQNLESGLYGGRDLTYLKSDALSGAEVAKTSAPLTFVTNFAAGGDSVWYLSEAALTATFYHPAATRSARSDGGAGGPILFSVNGQYVTLTLPAAPWGACVRTAATSAATHWQAYQ
ncbi:MAG: hypothetical protein NTW86_20590 [Candidatus Sumerlaeota bacterium]|nr:hypothetical protein [Candidatus Sumerlaeota bacterium]